MWVKTWLLRRAQHGHYDRLLKELATEDHPSLQNFTKVPTHVFRELLQKRLQAALQWLEIACGCQATMSQMTQL